MTENEKRINLNEPRYDQTTYLGRLKHFFAVTSPLHLLVTDNQLNEAKNIISNYEKGVNYDEEIIWDAKIKKDAIIHPDSGEKIPLPFRPCAFVPVNLLIAWGLLIPNASIPTMVFWQWFNQSYNVCFNHSNRNASNFLSNQQIFESYMGATATSCGIAVGMSLLLKKSNIFPPSLQKGMRMFLPFLAAGSAGAVNVYLMRRNELIQGISIFDEEGNEVGKSQIAGTKAINQVATSRVLTTLPILTIPPIALLFLSKTNLFTKFPRSKLPVELAIITGVLFTALPAAVAVFPQKSHIPSSQLEPHFHNLITKSGKSINEYIYNKGL